MPHWTPVDRGSSWDDGTGISAATDDDGSKVERVWGRLFGWDSANSVWRRILVDSTGALSTTGGGGGGGGAVTQGTSPWVVSGTISVSNFPATQPVSGTVSVGNFPATQPVSGTFWQTTQPVSAASLPLPTGAAQDSTLTGGSQKTKIVDSAGTNLLSVNASGQIAVSNFPATQPVSGTISVSNFPATQPVSGTISVSNFPASQAVTGTFWQATQPVSLAAAPTTPVTGTFWQATQPVSLATAPTTPVTGTFWQATQPVSAATLPLPTGAATSASQSTLKAASTIAATTDTASVIQQAPQRADAANLCVTTTAATGAAVTLTIPAAGAGLFHYISLIEIQLYATAARTGGATPVLVTTTNLPGSPVWDFDTAQAIGNTIRQTSTPATPIKSSVANTATTIVAPIATTGIWRITAYYYTAV